MRSRELRKDEARIDRLGVEPTARAEPWARRWARIVARRTLPETVHRGGTPALAEVA